MLKKSSIGLLKYLYCSLPLKRKKQLIYLVILAIISSFAESLNIISIVPFLELLSQPSVTLPTFGIISKAIIIQTNDSTVLIFLIAFLLLLIFTVLIRTLTLIFRAKLTARIGSDISYNIFTSIISKDFEWYSRQNTSKLLGFLTTDLDQSVATIDGVIKLVVNLALIIFMGFSIVLLAPLQVATLLILFSIYYSFVYYYIKPKQRKAGQKRSHFFKEALKSVQEALGFMRDIKLSKYEVYFTKKYFDNNFNYRDSISDITIHADSPRFFIEGIFISSVISLIVYNYFNGLAFEKQIPLLGALSFGAYRIMQPLNASFAVLNKIQSNIEAINNIKPFLSVSLNNSHYNKEPFKFKESNSVIKFENVSFFYSNSNYPILKNLSFEIIIGETVALVGATGCGKSTAIDIMMGLLEPTEGNVYVFDEDINLSTARKEAWQTLISHVPQSIYLSDDTIANNIALSSNHLPINQLLLEKCCKLAKIDTFLINQTNSPMTMIGERGVRLSGGQRQRIGIARALYNNNPVVILDEATSSLDNITEKDVLSNIRYEYNAKALIMIAHRLDTIKEVDKIFFMDKGTVVAIGTYEELKNSFKPFQDLISSGQLTE